MFDGIKNTNKEKTYTQKIDIYLGFYALDSMVKVSL